MSGKKTIRTSTGEVYPLADLPAEAAAVFAEFSGEQLREAVHLVYRHALTWRETADPRVMTLLARSWLSTVDVFGHPRFHDPSRVLRSLRGDQDDDRSDQEEKG